MIGNTALVELKQIQKDYNLKAKIYAKLEMNNPSGSIKDRTALGLIEDLEYKKIIKKNSVLITATSGNLGISLAFICEQKEYKCIIIMPEDMSDERKELIKSFNATLILSDKNKGMQGAIDKAFELLENNSNYIYVNQFENIANVKAHYKTGEEIIKAMPSVNIFINGIGSGGTITGVSKILKDFNNDIKVIGIEPSVSPLISKGIVGKHNIQGIGANFIPLIFSKENIDDIMLVSDEEALFYMNELFVKENIPAGISSGANLCCAINQAKLYPDSIIVIILPDNRNRYLS